MPDAKTLAGELVKALGAMPNPQKNANNPAFKRDGKPMRYADLEATLEACKPVLAEHGIALMQMPVNGESGEIGVRTVLIGHGEQMECGSFVLPMEGVTPQKAAGAVTYARRYALTALFGLAQEDDDANTASTATKQTAKLATESQIKAVWGKAKALGMDSDTLIAACKRDAGVDHPDLLTHDAARAMLDKMEAAIQKEGTA